MTTTKDKVFWTLKNKYSVDPENVRPVDIPLLIVYIMNTLEDLGTLPASRNELAIGIINDILDKSKLILSLADKEHMETIVGTYRAAESIKQTAKTFEKIGCCAIN